MDTRRTRRWLHGFAALLIGASAALTLAPATSDGARHEPLRKVSLLAGSDIPVPVRAILQRACQDCHSDETAWPWYANIPPVSWQIHSDVEKGRAFMDLSKWNDYTEGERQGFAVAIGTATRNHLMPPPKYTWLHREARLTSRELELVTAWASASHEPQVHSLEASTQISGRR
jgi:hypothetical protein